VETAYVRFEPLLPTPDGNFLEKHGVDTSEYRSRTMAVLNVGVMITGGTVTGPVAGGTHATASTVAADPGGTAQPAPGPTGSAD